MVWKGELSTLYFSLDFIIPDSMTVITGLVIISDMFFHIDIDINIRHKSKSDIYLEPCFLPSSGYNKGWVRIKLPPKQLECKSFLSEM